MTKIGYKKLRDDWIAKLSIKGVTNEARKGIAKKRYAKYRTDEAKVLKIFKINKNGKEINSKQKVSSLYDRRFKYRQGEIVKVDNYDNKLENECAPGIHYFKTYNQAFMWHFIPNLKFTGLKTRWYSNGNKAQESKYINGNLVNFKSWCLNGNRKEESNYNPKNNELHGVYRSWYSVSNKKWKECNYINGKLDGKVKRWDKNGKRMPDKEYNIY